MTRRRIVGLLPHSERLEAQRLTAEACKHLVELGAEVRVLESDAPELKEFHVDANAFIDGLDIAVSLGGDGTMLRAVDLVSSAGIPVIGVNVGQLGYLTEVEPASLAEALKRVVAGDYSVVERMMLSVEVEGSTLSGSWRALNEAVLEKSQAGRIVRLDVSINGTFFTTYAADGVIVATPTGSTAYSFSARGPIISPRHNAMVLTPVSPHMLFDRALVLDPSEEVRFDLKGTLSAVLTLDGREIGVLDSGASVRCTGAKHPALIATFGPRDFHQVLKAKFGLADR